MTALATQAQGGGRAVTPVDELKSILGKMQNQFMSAMATDEKRAERFTRIAQTAISLDPKLAECERTSVLAAFMQVAQLRLELDKSVGHCSIIRRWNGKLRREVASVQVEFKGYIEMARRSNEIASLMTGIVYEKDRFSRRITLQGEEFEHIPYEGGEDRGNWTRVYSLVHFKSGGYHLEVMSRDEVLAVRDQYSDGWNAFKQGKISSTPWSSAETEMARKTVIRRARKYWPLAVEDQRLLGLVERVQDAVERGAVVHAIDADTGSFQLAYDPNEADEVHEPEPTDKPAANSRLASLVGQGSDTAADKSDKTTDKAADKRGKASAAKSAKGAKKPEPEPEPASDGEADTGADNRQPDHDPDTGEILEPDEAEFFGPQDSGVAADTDWPAWVDNQGQEILGLQSRDQLHGWAKHPDTVAHLEVLKEANYPLYERIIAIWTARKKEVNKT